MSDRNAAEDLKSDADLEAELIQHIPYLLNHEPRLLGFPPMEFLMLFFVCVAAAQLSLILSFLFFIALAMFGKSRGQKSVDWFRYAPYAVFHVKYPYLLPPGERTFLP